jgi:hypothetical protein
MRKIEREVHGHEILSRKDLIKEIRRLLYGNSIVQ